MIQVGPPILLPIVWRAQLFFPGVKQAETRDVGALISGLGTVAQYADYCHTCLFAFFWGNIPEENYGSA